ncbi:DUF1553 domain-containing protein [Lunatimonas lonarensis]|uniref:DUF1553 domain-containing protein n=1 Tax=Lunatimonas lonarensis TaxID=1232681 RepID=UPI0004AF9CD7|nr:DUF1553 domain-containing protein [Lunatimonas lonarensis]
MRRHGLNILLIAIVALTVVVWAYRRESSILFSEEVEAALPEEIDFNLHIKPILSDRCFACHGPDENKREAGLRLDDEAFAFAAFGEGKRQYALVPGKPHKSAVYHRIVSTDPDLIMPPPESNLVLSPTEIALITRWIEQGAAYKPHWSFIPPSKPELPPVDRSDWATHPIDRFVYTKMVQQGLEPSEQASKETLIRRVSFDLIGLPPSVEEVDEFLLDTSPNAYEKLVDRLLQSPHFGERMASEWLDVARYADSHGYQDDGMRNMWPWRDWVIRSFNANLPYDEFIVWQLAGDLLPEATVDQVLATGFNRNHPQSQEGGVIPEEYRVEYVADRANTLGKAFLGLSTECARCHDHKYDPLSQKEYFQLYAFFNSIKETGQVPYMGEPSPTLILTDEETEEKLAYIREKISEQERELDPNREEYRKGFEKWLLKMRANPPSQLELPGRVGHYPLDAPIDNQFKNIADPAKPASMVVIQTDKDLQVVEGKVGNAVKLVGDSFVDLGNQLAYFERNEPFSISLWYKALADSLKGPIFSKTGGFANGFRGYELLAAGDGTLRGLITHTWPANGIEVWTKEKVPVGEWVHLAMVYDGSSKASGLQLFLNGKPLTLEVETDNLRRSILSYGKEKRSIGHPGNLQIGKRGTNFAETLDQSLVDEFSVFDRRLSAIEVEALHSSGNPLSSYLAKGMEKELFDHYLLSVDQVYQGRLNSLTQLRGEESAVLSAQPEVMVMQERQIPLPTHVLARGTYDAPAEQVFPGTPSAIMAFAEDFPQNRLGLAKWVVHENNPLTARVAVNRYWQLVFGRGIVSTVDDFGNQGAFPSHPELLDWLAVHFRESGWNVKELLKLLVTSATYKQSSERNDRLREKDPDNVWLARGPSYRMPVEMIRDNALAVSGLLSRDIGGRSVKPYQPDGLWKELATANVREYVQDTGGNLYRRGLYTIWKRSSPPPSMISFDASDKYTCTVERQKTNTPLQALVLMNDPQYVEAARALAERMIREGGLDTEEQIRYGFKAMTSRSPNQRELGILRRQYELELEEFRTAPHTALGLLKLGDSSPDPRLPREELAAMTLVASTLVNYDDAVYKR